MVALQPEPSTSLPTGRRTKSKKPQPNGRPPAITPEVLDKLEQVFALGGTDDEACLYAGVAPATLYKYQEKHPEFAERKRLLKETPVLQARQTVVSSLKSDKDLAFKFLQARRKDEFGQRVEMTGKDGGPLELGIVGIVREAAQQQLAEPPEERRRPRQQG